MADDGADAAEASLAALAALPPPSDEQAAALRSLVDEGRSVVLESVAGSGKTTFAMHAALRLARRGLRTLVLTYNAQLKRETRQRVRALGAEAAAEVHSYHSFGYRYLSEACSTDDGLSDTLDALDALDALERGEDGAGDDAAASAAVPMRPRALIGGLRFDLLVLDECQDMKPLFLRLVRAVERHNACPRPRYVVVGDPRQSIYGFQGADARFLTLADRVFGGAPAATPRPWARHRLSVTWRLTRAMGELVNDAFFAGERVLEAPREGAHAPRYLLCDSFGDAPARAVRGWLEDGVPPEGVMVLAPSLRSRASPVRALENRLVRAGVRVYVPVSDEEPVDRLAVRGKVLFATFHQAKGAEREAVLAFGMDASYVRYFARGSDGAAPPNPVYVAATRARERLALVHDRRNAPLPFLRLEHVARLARVEIEGAELLGGDAALLQRDPRAALERACAAAAAAEAARAAQQQQQQAPQAQAASALAPPPPASPSTSPSASPSAWLAAQRQLRRYGVHDLLRHLPREALRAACAHLRFRAIAARVPGAPLLQLDAHAPGGGPGGTVEQVAEITGVALPALATGKARDIAAHALELCACARQRARLEAMLAPGAPPLSAADALYAAAVYTACASGYMFKPAQIRRYDWLPDAAVAAAAGFMRGVGAADPDARHEVELAADAPDLGVAVRGRADVVVPGRALYEVKCTAGPQREHRLQLALYAWMVARRDGAEAAARLRYVLAYACTGEVLELEFDAPALERAVAALAAAKAAPAAAALDDAAFLTRNGGLRETAGRPAVSREGGAGAGEPSRSF